MIEHTALIFLGLLLASTNTLHYAHLIRMKSRRAERTRRLILANLLFIGFALILLTREVPA